MNKCFQYVLLPKKPPKINAENKTSNLFCSQISNFGKDQSRSSSLFHIFQGSSKARAWNHLKTSSLTCMEVDAGCMLTSQLGQQLQHHNMAHLYSPSTSSLPGDQAPRMSPAETSRNCMAFSDLASEVIQHHNSMHSVPPGSDKSSLMFKGEGNQTPPLHWTSVNIQTCFETATRKQTITMRWKSGKSKHWAWAEPRINT